MDMLRMMRFILVWLPVLGCYSQGMAQGGGFILLQTEPSQPFFVRMGDSLYHSSKGNYLILAPIIETGTIIVGLQGQRTPVAVFTVADSTMETSLVLKDQGLAGWRLINMQTNEMLNIRRPGQGELYDDRMTKRSDAFAKRLSLVVDDEAILFQRSSESKSNKTFNPLQVAIFNPPVEAKTRQEALVPVRRLEMMHTPGSVRITYEVREREGTDIVVIEIPKGS